MVARATRRPSRLDRLQLPERVDLIGMSLGEAERSFQIFADDRDLLNLTYADTKRYPAPDWALPAFVEAATGHTAEAYTPYRGSAAVRSVVADSLTSFVGVNVDPDRNLALTAGTQSALFCALASLVEAGDRVALLDPEYLSTERMLRFFGAEVEHVAVEMSSNGPQIDLAMLRQLASGGVRLLVLSHPNNPTGAVYSRDVMRELAAIVSEYDLFVVIDELYARLVYDDLPYSHLAAFDDMAERVVTLLGPSKTEQMSGYRVGCAIGPELIIQNMEDVQAITSIRAPAYAQHVLRHWLRDDRDFIAGRVRDYCKMRDLAYDRLSSLDFVDLHRAQGTSYLFPSVAALKRPDHEVAQALLNHAGVIVNPGYQFGPRGVGSFRLCFAQEEQSWADALDRIHAVLENLASVHT